MKILPVIQSLNPSLETWKDHFFETFDSAIKLRHQTPPEFFLADIRESNLIAGSNTEIHANDFI